MASEGGVIAVRLPMVLVAVRWPSVLVAVRWPDGTDPVDNNY